MADLHLLVAAWIPDRCMSSCLPLPPGLVFDPANYPDRGEGFFFVGLEANGMIYAFALNQVDGSAIRIASFSSGFSQVMGKGASPRCASTSDRRPCPI